MPRPHINSRSAQTWPQPVARHQAYCCTQCWVRLAGPHKHRAQWALSKPKIHHLGRPAGCRQTQAFGAQLSQLAAAAVPAHAAAAAGTEENSQVWEYLGRNRTPVTSVSNRSSSSARPAVVRPERSHSHFSGHHHCWQQQHCWQDQYQQQHRHQL